MQTEIEVKFPDVDFAAVRLKLEALGAVCEQPMRLMRRAIIETPELEAKNAYVRIRDEGNKVTLTYKQFDEQSLTGAKEIELVVSDFEKTIALFEQVELVQKSFQESRRETWQLGTVEIVLDEWPWLNPYIEVEGPSEQGVRDVAAQLGFDWSDAVFGKVTELYQRQYPKGDSSKTVTVPHLTFDDPLPAIISGQPEGV
ncbi:MAG TPA: CYTH domain-containing protein [Candidatus Saccharimonadales bacterium]|nr:CYTH domain-containing protein [Candidatus Saccharimonadales bacterium]